MPEPTERHSFIRTKKKKNKKQVPTGYSVKPNNNTQANKTSQYQQGTRQKKIKSSHYHQDTPAYNKQKNTSTNSALDKKKPVPSGHSLITKKKKKKKKNSTNRHSLIIIIIKNNNKASSTNRALTYITSVKGEVVN